MKKLKISVYALASVAFFAVAIFVYLRPYDECGGPKKCYGDVCLDVCAPTGIRHSMPIAIALLSTAIFLVAKIVHDFRNQNI